MKIFTVPNILTLLRFLCSAWICIIAYYRETQSIVAVGLIGFGALTDYLDGKIARTWPSQQSKLGEYIDPPADKFLVFSGMVYLAQAWPWPQWVEYACFAVIIVREAGMMLLRAYGGPAVFPVSDLGKWKAFLQMLAILFYAAALSLTGYATSILARGVGFWILFMATALTLYTFGEYLLQYLRRTSPSVGTTASSSAD